MRIVADRGACRGAGQCVFTAPELFDQDDVEGRVVVLVAEPDDPASASRAVQACPNRALSLAPAAPGREDTG